MEADNARIGSRLGDLPVTFLYLDMLLVSLASARSPTSRLETACRTLDPQRDRRKATPFEKITACPWSVPDGSTRVSLSSR